MFQRINSTMHFCIVHWIENQSVSLNSFTSLIYFVVLAWYCTAWALMLCVVVTSPTADVDLLGSGNGRKLTSSKLSTWSSGVILSCLHKRVLKISSIFVGISSRYSYSDKYFFATNNLMLSLDANYRLYIWSSLFDQFVKMLADYFIQQWLSMIQINSEPKCQFAFEQISHPLVFLALIALAFFEWVKFI